jgi:hypothetical protein
MLISEMWKQKAKEIITMVWKDKISSETVEKYLNSIIEVKKPFFPILEMRNLYTNKGLRIALDEIFNIIEQEDLCIEGNNTLTYSYRKVKSPIPKILIELKAERDKHKKKAKELSEQMTKLRKEGMAIENPKYREIEIQWGIEDFLEKAIKTLMNSIYGVQGQNGSIIYAPDTAGAVTSQGRALISEMMWSIERFLYGTIHFTSFSEFFTFFNELLKEVDYATPLLNYITYIPTKADIRKKFISLLYNIPDSSKELKNIEVTLYHFINSLDKTQRIFLYYKCDFLKLVLQNKAVGKIITTMLEDPSSFNSILEKDTPPSFIPLLSELARLIDMFVLIKLPTSNRTIKYTTRRRRGILLSDTDSIVINLHPFVKKFSEYYYTEKGIDLLPCEHLVFNNEEMAFKIVNIMSYLCTHVTKVTADIFCKSSNIPEELRKWIAMKNEYYFMRMILYTNAKKNYITYIKLNEGKIQDEVSATGIKLNSSILNTYVHDKIMDIIEHKILKSEQVDSVSILKDVKELEKDIIKRITNGDITFGKKGRYSGIKGYKDLYLDKEGKATHDKKKADKVIPGVYINNVGRSCYIWNLLYPSSKINVGDYAYVFNLTLENENKLSLMEYRYPEEYKKVKKLILENNDEPYLPRYGLRSIAIPITNTITFIPTWIIDFIDYEEITNKHLQPIISLLPSIGIHKSRISSAKSTYSPLIAF